MPTQFDFYTNSKPIENWSSHKSNYIIKNKDVQCTIDNDGATISLNSPMCARGQVKRLLDACLFLQKGP